MATLDPDQWQALSPYLDEALAMTEKERSLWLSSLRSQNQEHCRARPSAGRGEQPRLHQRHGVDHTHISPL
jgi:hypothetical protein